MKAAREHADDGIDNERRHQLRRQCQGLAGEYVAAAPRAHQDRLERARHVLAGDDVARHDRHVQRRGRSPTLSVIAAARSYLLMRQLTAWHDLFQTPVAGDAIIRSPGVSSLFAVPPLAVAWAVFARRDVTT